MSAAGLALVTGASSGIGRGFARDLAARGHPLLLVARRERLLQDLAAELHAQHGVDARVAACDLSTPEGRAACRAALDAHPVPLEVLVLNAGFGSHGDLAGMERADEVRMVDLNCAATVDLAAHAMPGLVARGRGTVIVISSAAALQPLPYMATYAATKAFGLRFARAVAEEVRGAGVRVIAVCPGPIRGTEFTTAATGEGLAWPVPQPPVEAVVRATWRALARGRTRVNVGPVAHLATVAAALVPEGVVARAARIVHWAVRRRRR